MFRSFAVAATLALAIFPAQAEDSLTTRIHEAAVKACAAKVGANLPIIYYRAFSEHCVDQVSAAALAAIRAREVAKAEAPSAAN